MLVIMSKEPVPGEVKTRLLPRLSFKDAADLYRCFLLDRLSEMSGLPGIDAAVAYTPASSAAAFTSLVPGSFSLFPQQGGSLTERLTGVVSRVFAGGYRYVSIVDSDSPDLPGGRVLESFTLLREGADVVFGPCRDGGYYLVGLRVDRGEIFEDIPWSTSRVLEESVARARSLGLEVALLEPWQDIDTFDDLLDFVRRRQDGTGEEGAPSTNTLAFLRRKNVGLPNDRS